MSQNDPREILNTRLASGEISEEEYDRIRARLDAAGCEEISSPSLLTAAKPNAVSATPVTAGNHSSAKRFILARLWKGDISLPVTYWCWGALGSLVVGLIIGVFLSIATTMGGVAIGVLILLAWGIFITVAIFRSGGTYQRQNPGSWWGRIAQVMACLGLLSNIGSVTKLLPGNESEAELDQVIAEANQAGAHMIATNIRFDKLHRTDRTFIYEYTVTGDTHIPLPEDINDARNAAVKQMCDDSDSKRLLLIIDKALFNYVNAAGQHLMSYDVSHSDCI
ncbi:MAG: SHOCT domain-containing protein [Geminicoccaceae bacterium]